MASTTEGKTIAVSSQKCEACRKYVSFGFCNDCSMTLCSDCTDTHKNIPATKYHSISINKGSTKSPSGSINKAQSCNCPKHKEKILRNACKQCANLICDSCLPDHTGHDIQPLKNDPSIYRKLCSEHIKNLLDELHEAEEIKKILEGNITIYNEAANEVDKWEQDLLQMVKTKAVRLRQKIKAMKEEKSKLLSDRVNGLLIKIQEIDQTITKLNNNRKSMDLETLTKELSNSQALILKLETLKSDLKPMPKQQCVDDIISNGKKIKHIQNDIDALFSITDSSVERPMMTGPEIVNLIKFGTRVVRGADWTYGNQDGYPPGEGTVTEISSNETVEVEWDRGNTENYRMGLDGKYELKLA